VPRRLPRGPSPQIRQQQQQQQQQQQREEEEEEEEELVRLRRKMALCR
jgi:hypothetical protein